jgi:hypothetical protein
MSGAIAMGAQKITGLTNGSAAQDAAAFGQIPSITGLAPLASPVFTTALASTPPTSHTARAALGALTVGTAYQNTLAYDVVVNVAIVVTAATAASFSAGVGPTSTPTTDALTGSLSIGTVLTFSFYVPAGYYLLLTDSGTITLGSTTTTVFPV